MAAVHAAKVVLADAVYGYDMEYTYKYPDLLYGVLKAGMRVLVPFGRSNSKRIGLVTRVYDKDQPDERIKPIISLIDREPLLNDELVDMVSWLKEHTFCTYFEAYRTIVPAGYSVVHKSVYALANHMPDVELDEEENALYQMLKGCLSRKEFDSILDSCLGDGSAGKSKANVIKSLVEKGVLEQSDEFKRRVSDETVRMIRLAPDFEEKCAGLTPKQRLVADFLSENESASVKETCYYLSVTQTIITNMIKKGLLIEYRYEALRVPERSANTHAWDVVLSDEQSAAYEGIAKLVDAAKPAGALLHGVTGSGKTAVFMSLIKHVLDKGKTAIMLVPEISLTPQTVNRFCSVFGDAVAVIHSGLSVGQRLDEFKRIKRGDAKIVIGTRSAIFAPLTDIGIIIMDEEGESSYKSDSSPRYHARDVAIKRCATHNCVLLMASATPSLETYYYAKKGRYSLFELKKRYGDTKLPQVVVADMITEAENGNDGMLCLDMVRRIRSELKKNKQTILLLNRRGYNTNATCLSCHSPIKCPNCLVPLTYHKSNGKLMCHYCGYFISFDGRCPTCHGDRVRLSGIGTQKLEEELSSLFPSARVLRMDADTTYSRYAYEESFSEFANGAYDIMVGTQMIAKGLDFPNVTTVGVISLDSSLFAGDFRSYERTFSLLTQVAGRGGRGDSEAVAYIQTFVPDHHVIALAAKQDYKGFFEQEIALRRELIYPPFCDICTVYFCSAIESDAVRAAHEFVSMMRQKIANISAKFPLRVLGPAKSGYGRINNRYKYALTIKCRMSSAFRSFISELLADTYKNKTFSNTRVYVDINGET